MAENRFKKSIETATDNTRENMTENIEDIILVKQIENVPENILEKVLQNGGRSKGGNHTIYLSAEVGDALVKYAKKAKKSKSEFVDDILREVFKI